MTDDGLIFDFESDVAGSARCVPMVVCLKLDLCGIKLSKDQWGRFTAGERDRLAVQPCGSPAERSSYKDGVVGLIAERTGQQATMLPIDPHPGWADTTTVPAQLRARTAEQRVPAPPLAAWATLSPLRRFALFKLTRPGHANANLLPAMREFGLLDPDATSALTQG